MIDFNRLDRKELESIGIVFLDQYTESEFRVSASREFHRRMDSAVWRGLSEKDPSFLDQIKKEKGKMEWYEAINPDSRSIAADIAYSMEMEIIAFKTHIDGVILCKEDKDLSGDLIETLDYPFAIKLRLKCVGIRTIGDLLRYGDLSHIDRLGQESIYLIKHTLWDYLHSRIVPAPKITAPIYKFDILNLIGRQVFHKRYGDGEVTGQTPTELIVKFKTRESKFSFPNQYTFSRYLVAKDPELQASMREMVTLYEAAKKSDLCGNGDLFFYPKYPLIYSSEKIRALGEHLDEGLPERSVDAIIKNHIVHEANMAMNNYDFNHPRFKPAMDNSAEEIVDKYLDEFKEYHLSPIGKSELRGFLRYLLQNKIKDIPYHFLIQAETDYVGVGFSNDLLGVIAKIKNKTLKIESWSESDLLSKPDKEKLLSCDVLGIRSALSDAKYYMNDYDSSGDSSKKQDYDYRWNDIMGFFDSHPNKLVFMCAPKNIAQGRIKNNTRMYYRFFKHRIIIGNMGEDEIIDSLMAKIKEAKIDYSLQFFDQIKEYIRTVYPKADLKNMEFVDDLYKWMLALSFQNLGTGLFFNDASIPFYHHKKTFDELNSDFQQLVGLDEVKQTFWDIGMLCQSLNSSATKPYLHMVFRGNPGTGKTTVANHIARLLNAMGVIRTSKVVEVMVGDLIAGYVGQTPFKVKRAIEKARGGVLFVDEAYMLDSESGGSHSDHYRQECIVTLMQAMDNRVDPIIIFAGYPKQMDDFLNANPGLVSRIGYNIEFKDYSDDQLVDIFRAMCESSGYEYDLLTLEAVRQKITALRYEKNFGNARTVENIFNQAAMECLRSDASRRFITQNHIVISKDIKTINELQRELDNLVGIESAKQIIHQQIMSNRFAKEQGKKLPTSNNMVFVGNAGTGKTTTAKLCAEMLFSIGVAKSPRTKLISAKDLYVQDVAKKLNEYCDDVMGGVLFIDEIYLLQKNAYISTEVISVLLDVLEQKKEDLTFILAGYEKQMDEFLSENQGLKSRFPITVHFNDFTLDELCQIFMKECREYEMQVSDDALEKFSAVIEKAMKQENFGNGRAVRNIFENAYRKHSVRYFSEEEVDPDCFTADDIDAPVEINEKKINLGFGN